MIEERRTLPDYKNPPVVEVVLSVQFDPLNRLNVAHIGLLWSKFKDRLPLTTERQPIAPIFETFGLPTALQIETTFTQRVPIPRVWFFNQETTDLIQIQQDRLLRNWRKKDLVCKYP